MDMRTLEPPQSDMQTGWAPSELIRQDPTESKRSGLWSRLFERWYRLTAPAEPPENAGFVVRERVRRGRLASIILLAVFCLDIGLGFPIGIFTHYHMIAFLAIGMLIVAITASMFNRRGLTNITGLIIALGFEMTIVGIILSDPKGLEASSLPLFDILVYTELFVASLLPANWIFPATLVNIAFIIFDMSHQPRSPEFAVTMATLGPTIMGRSIGLHIVVSLVLWLWIRGATQAIKRADRAEVIAELEHTIAVQGEIVKSQNQKLNWSIQQIVDTLWKVGNGDASARVPLTQGNVLWQVGGSLNNLLGRVQRFRQDAVNLERTNAALARFYEARMQAQDDIIRGWTITGTLVDSLVRQHNILVEQRTTRNSPSPRPGQSYEDIQMSPSLMFHPFKNNERESGEKRPT